MKFFTTTINLPAWWILLGCVCLLILAADRAMNHPAPVRANSSLMCHGGMTFESLGAAGGYGTKVTCQ